MSGWRFALRVLAVLAMLGFSAVAPDARAQAFVVRDDRGAEHRFAAPPQRIVTMMPSLTETICVLGACGRLVGVDRYSNWPGDVAGLPHLGGLEDAQIESIAALKPDVILASTASRAMDRLEALGFPVVRLKSDTYSDVRHTLDLVGRLLGEPGAGERTWTRLQQEVDTAAARVPAAWRDRRVYFEVGGGPYAAGTTSFIGETLTR
ncbi:MAG TPA: helical backbone metal receptor, partial [Burkholderiaceae bacterium]|nr:helical backbone metal receptor [Burkholderiaceae bacterium]